MSVIELPTVRARLKSERVFIEGCLEYEQETCAKDEDDGGDSEEVYEVKATTTTGGL